MCLFLCVTKCVHVPTRVCLCVRVCIHVLLQLALGQTTAIINPQTAEFGFFLFASQVAGLFDLPISSFLKVTLITGTLPVCEHDLFPISMDRGNRGRYDPVKRSSLCCNPYKLAVLLELLPSQVLLLFK